MSRKRILISAISVAVVVLLFWQFRHSPEWRQFSWAAVWTATRQARGSFILAGIGLIYMSYVLRAWRWRVLMSPTGEFWPTLKGNIVGFTGTAFLGRAAELVRPYYIARKHRRKLPGQLAVWLIERIFDMAGTVFLVAIDLAVSPEVKQLTSNPTYRRAFHQAGVVLVVAVIVIVGLLYVFHLRSHHLLKVLRRPRHPSPLRRRITEIFATLEQGMSALRRGQTLVVAVVFTMLVWIDVSAAFWMVIRGYPQMLPHFGFSEGVLLMGLTSIGSVAQLPAVGGGFQAMALFGLIHIFGAETAAATSAALILWLVAFYAVSPFGIAIVTHEGVSWRGMEREAIQEEEAQVGGES